MSMGSSLRPRAGDAKCFPALKLHHRLNATVKSMVALDPATRQAVLLEYQKTPNYERVARRLNVDWRTVKRWVSRFEETGTVMPVAGLGRKPKVSEAAARKAGELLLSSEFDNCHEVAKELHNLGLTTSVVHASTVSRRAKAQACADGTPIVAKTGKPGKALTEATMAKRRSFCETNKTRSWARVMITDRKKFYFRYPGTSVKRVQWLRKGEQRVAFRPNSPQAVNLYAGITKYGVTKAHLVTGTSKLRTSFRNKKGQDARNITSAEYEKVLAQTLLPEGKRLFASAGVTSWVLQQDNDPTHKRAAGKALQAWNSRKSGMVELLPEWPPHSPDLSPIENAWAYVQAKVDAAGCKTFEEFLSRVLKEWRELPISYIKSLMNSLPARLNACLELDGKKTRY